MSEGRATLVTAFCRIHLRVLNIILSLCKDVLTFFKCLIYIGSVTFVHLSISLCQLKVNSYCDI